MSPTGKRAASPTALEPPSKRARLEPDEYLVRVGDREFVLNREQVETDAPSLLSTALLVRLSSTPAFLIVQGDWAEGRERVLDLKHAHDPDLFRLVVNHLRSVRPCVASLIIQRLHDPSARPSGLSGDDVH